MILFDVIKCDVLTVYSPVTLLLPPLCTTCNANTTHQKKRQPSQHLPWMQHILVGDGQQEGLMGSLCSEGTTWKPSISWKCLHLRTLQVCAGSMHSARLLDLYHLLNDD
jgi:hypothetical protein